MEVTVGESTVLRPPTTRRGIVAARRNRARPISSEILENVSSLFEKIQRKSTILNIRICVREVELKLEGFNFEQFYSSFYISLVGDQSL